MPADKTIQAPQSFTAVRRERAKHVPRTAPERDGLLVVNPRYQEELAAHNLITIASLLDFPGEVVSGHPSRHVVQVVLPSSEGPPRTAYLKRQHLVRGKERWRNALAGFGFVSKSVREARMLQQLEAAGFAVPEWLAFGESADGRAFLLVAEVADAVDLRAFLADPRTTIEDRRRCAERIGQALAELHAAGFHHPDATAKHVLLHPETMAVTLLDWQSARRFDRPSECDRQRSLAALHASLADNLATPSERARFLWAYRRVLRHTERRPQPRFAAVEQAISRAAVPLQNRRSIRDQRESSANTSAQRLVWLAGEAACVVPDVAGTWPEIADGAPFYDSACRPDRLATEQITLAEGRRGALVRGHTFAPVSRFLSRVRGKLWRSPELRLARLFFHFDRYGVPAPRLLAFGQKLTTRCRAEGFVLYEPPAQGVPLEDWYRRRPPRETRLRILEAVGLLVRQLHDAGCRLDRPFADEPLVYVAEHESLVPVVLGAVRSVRLVRKVSRRARERDVRRWLLGPLARFGNGDTRSFLRGYHGSQWRDGGEASERNDTR